MTGAAYLESYEKAVVQLASDRSDLGPDLRKWLRGFVAGLPDEAPDELKV